ncbi:MAG TPA: hypothetical protein VK557_13275 [Pyrinomonadaceae bacterium]|nr:hypothetical protein [Pyrinomonadaceae bacterium]
MATRQTKATIPTGVPHWTNPQSSESSFALMLHNQSEDSSSLGARFAGSPVTLP